MYKMDPTEILNDNMEFLIDHLMRELRCLGKMNGLSNSQLIYMEREFIARLAFAAIIGDDEKPDEKPEKKPEKSDGLPSDVINALLYVKHNICECHDCDECPFGSSGGLVCRLNEFPSVWEV